MKNKVVLTLLASLLTISMVMAEEVSKKKISNQKDEIKKQSVIDFGDYVNSRPEEVILFETSTRMINFETKKMEIMDVSKPTPIEVFDQSSFIEVKKFDADFSGIKEIEGFFDRKSYPQKRIEDKCTLTVEEYGLYLEGRFVDENIFKVSKLKPKLIDSMTNRYCKNGSSLKSKNTEEFIEIDNFKVKEVELKKTASFEIY